MIEIIFFIGKNFIMKEKTGRKKLLIYDNLQM